MRALLLLVLLCITVDASSPLPCQWVGVAPICIAECPKGMREVMRSAEGKTKAFGKSCLLGTKAFCCSEGYLPQWTGHRQE